VSSKFKFWIELQKRIPTLKQCGSPQDGNPKLVGRL
jgi:hypothetical protein